jgi:hypothetical protein
MLNLKVLERIIKYLEPNLNTIKTGVSTVYSVYSNHNSTIEPDIYDSICVYFKAVNNVKDTEKEILNLIPALDIFHNTNQELFSSEMHDLIIETQSQLNVLCDELNLPKMYLASITSSEDEKLEKLAHPESAQITLAKAFSVLNAAKTFLPAETKQ